VRGVDAPLGDDGEWSGEARAAAASRGTSTLADKMAVRAPLSSSVINSAAATTSRRAKDVCTGDGDHPGGGSGNAEAYGDAALGGSGSGADGDRTLGVEGCCNAGVVAPVPLRPPARVDRPALAAHGDPTKCPTTVSSVLRMDSISPSAADVSGDSGAAVVDNPPAGEAPALCACAMRAPDCACSGDDVSTGTGGGARPGGLVAGVRTCGVDDGTGGGAARRLPDSTATAASASTKPRTASCIGDVGLEADDADVRHGCPAGGVDALGTAVGVLVPDDLPLGRKGVVVDVPLCAGAAGGVAGAGDATGEGATTTLRVSRRRYDGMGTMAPVGVTAATAGVLTPGGGGGGELLRLRGRAFW